MTDPTIEVVKPSTMREALRILARPSPRALPLGGGTHLALHPAAAKVLVDLSGLALAGIRVKGGRCEAGAMTTLAQIASSSRLPAALRTAVRRETNRNLRQQATLGGALAVREPGPLLACLLALGAEVALEPEKVGEGLDRWLRRKVTGRRSVQLITGVSWDSKPSLACADVARSPMDRPIVFAAAAAMVEGGRLSSVRVVLTGAGQPLVPQMKAARILEGASAVDIGDRMMAAAGMLAVDWVDDIRGTAEYRAAVAPVLVRRALAQLLSAGA
ncbi:MAG: FAD binding domain-containing protein [Chloroflexi bacterium]|nr:FAD binding domain-containing protein [Chloroflexota bacterium]